MITPAFKSVTGALEPGTFPLRWELCASSYLHDLFCNSMRPCYQFIDLKIIPKMSLRILKIVNFSEATLCQ